MFPVLEFDDHHKNEYHRSSQKALISRFRGVTESLIICCKWRSSAGAKRVVVRQVYSKTAAESVQT